MNNKKSSIYKDIYDSKFFLKVLKKSLYEIKIPKSSFDKIISLYGHETILPLSFIYFCNPVESKETLINMSASVNLHSTLQINQIMNSVNNLYIYPSSYEGFDEIEKIRRSPKIKNKYLKNISKKMGMDFSDMINYISIQIITIQMKESIKIIKSLEIYLKVFNNIHILGIKFPNKEKFDIAYYSYKTILNMSGITIDKMFPLFNINKLKNKTRDDILNNEKNILYDKVLARELKEGINDVIKEKKVDIYKGTNQCKRILKPNYNDFEYFREKQSNLLNQLNREPKGKIIEIIKDLNKNSNNKTNENSIKVEEKKEIINEDQKEDNQENQIIVEKLEHKENDIVEIKENNIRENHKKENKEDIKEKAEINSKIIEEIEK